MDCKQIGQPGRVIQITPESYKISLVNSACGSCKLKGVCPSSKTRIIEVDKDKYDLKQGELVTIYMEENMGLRALFLSYILPFFILLIVLIAVKAYTKDDGIAGLAALGSLIPYYFILFLFRKKLGKKFTFTIKPQ